MSLLAWLKPVVTGFLLAGLAEAPGSTVWRPDPYGLVALGLAPGDGRPVERTREKANGELARGLAAVASGQPTEAASHLVRAVLLDPTDAQARMALGDVWLDAGDYEAALSQFRLLESNRPDDPELLYQMSLAYQGLGQTAEALACAEGVVSQRPNWGPALVRLGLVRVAAGDRLGGEAMLVRAYDAPGMAAFAYFQAGTHFLETGAPARALRYLRRALVLKPDYSWAANNLGNALKALDQPEEAKQAYQLAIAADAENPNPHNGMGVLREAAGDLVGALDSYRAALAADANCVDARYNAGVVLAKLGRTHEAYMQLDAARVLRPDYALTYIQLAQVLLKLGDIRGARALTRKATALDPSLMAPAPGTATAREEGNR